MPPLTAGKDYPTVILVSPAEPLAIRDLGKTSSIPEKFGADLLFYVGSTKIGVQRKELSDLVASVYDGRLGRELLQMKALDRAALFIEGRPKWTTEGELLHRGGKFSRAQLNGIIYSVQQEHNLIINFTTNIDDTIAALMVFMRWQKKPGHGSLEQRPKPVAPWGTMNDRDWGVFLLQSFPGIGRVLASTIYDHFGRLPISWEVTEADLMKIEGIGEKKAKSIIKLLGKGGVRNDQ